MPASRALPTAGPAPDNYRWLTSEAAREWLRRLAASEESLTAQAQRLRASCTAEQTHLVLEQISLRRRARTKFALADQMFFTDLGLQQATDERVARHKAARFAGRGSVVDLCCGIGGDLIALAEHNEAVGIDRDPVAAIIAQANVAIGASAREGTAADIKQQDVHDVDLEHYAAWHIDPDRRPTGRRTTHVEWHDPSAEVIDTLRARQPHAAIKLAPATELPDAWREQAELEWISRDRQCRQLVAWFGDLARAAGTRSASVLGGATAGCRTVTGIADIETPTASRLGRYVMEPDAAVLAAGLAGALAAEHALGVLTPSIAYWTGDEAISDAALACFEVRDVLPLRVKTIKTYLREHDIGRLEIKKRGVPDDPDALRRQLRLKGDRSATLLLTRHGKQMIAIVAVRAGSHTSAAETSESRAPDPSTKNP